MVSVYSAGCSFRNLGSVFTGDESRALLGVRIKDPLFEKFYRLFWRFIGMLVSQVDYCIKPEENLRDPSFREFSLGCVKLSIVGLSPLRDTGAAYCDVVDFTEIRLLLSKEAESLGIPATL